MLTGDDSRCFDGAPSSAVTPSPVAAGSREEQRLDLVYDERSSQSQGIWRLKMPKVVRLMVGDEVFLMVPPSNHKVPKTDREPRRRLLSEFRKVILSSAPSDARTREDRDKFVNDEYSERTIQQSGAPHIEFNIRVAKYPERSKFSLPNPLKINIDHWLGIGRTEVQTPFF